MMTLAPIRSAVHAASYFESGDHADYYLADDVCPSEWIGKGAELLGVKGLQVAPERFKRYLNGDIAGQSIGTERNGAWQHKPGWDLQFSPSKSVSVAALVGGDQTIVWNPAAWGAKSQAFRQAECDLSIGDKLIWSVKDKDAGVTNGSKAVVQKIDVEGKTAEIEFASGCRRTISLKDHQSQHWNYDYVTTVHAAQGKTADRVLFHAESFRRNLSSQKALYVAVSRAKNEVTIYTDNKEMLIEQIKEQAGEKQNAIEKEKIRSGSMGLIFI